MEEKEKKSPPEKRENGMAILYSSFFKWLVIAVAVGIIDGIGGAAFHHALDFATEFRTEHDVIIFALPIAGLLIVLLYGISGMKDDKGTNGIILEARGKHNVKFRLAPLIMSAAFFTHLCGGSAGREGAALQIGASLVSPIGKLLKMDEKDMSVLAMCGMAAGFSALFGTPAAAAVFALEVAIVGAMRYTAAVPCFIASAAASVTAGFIGVSPTSFTVLSVPSFVQWEGALTLLKCTALGILCSAVSILFCEAMHISGAMYKKYIKNGYIRAAAGGVIVIALTFIMGTRDYNGAGMDVINRAFAGEAAPAAFLIKIVMTALTLGAGFKGGEIVPSFFVGSTFGCAAAPLLGLDPSFGAAVGLAAVFCGVTNCPLATTVLSVELFGAEGLVFYVSAIAVSYMLSGYTGLYTEQVFMFSKSRLEKMQDE